MSDRCLLTAEGAKALRLRVERMKGEDRPRLSQAIAEARAHGDLKENAEYHAAREEQSFLEARIAELEGVLAKAQIIDVSNLDAGGRVVFGSTVELLRPDGKKGKRICYRIVGEAEADIEQMRISISSPIARALIGKEAGDEVEVQTPGGCSSYEIVSVRYE